MQVGEQQSQTRRGHSSWKAWNRNRLRVVRQLAATDCGAAALAMVLGYHGRRVELSDVRDVLAPGRDGVDAAAIISAASRFGLRGRGVRLELSALQTLPTASILYWRFRHFVVFDRMRKDGVEILDPATGRRFVELSEFGRYFTGVALLFEPSGEFEYRPGNSGSVSYGWFGQILRSRGLFTKILTASVLAQTAGALVPLLTGLVIDRVVPHSDAPLLLELFLGYCLFQSFSVLAGYIRAQLLVYFKAQLEASFTLRFLNHLIELPYSFFQQHTAGDLLVRLGGNEVIRDMLTSTALSTLLDGFMAVVYCALLSVISVKLTAVVALLACLRLLLLVIVRWRQKILLNSAIENQGSVQTYQVEMLVGMETLKSMGLESRAVEHWSSFFMDGLNISIRRGRLDAASGGFLSLLGTANTIVFLFLGTYMVIQRQMTLGEMVAVNALAIGFLTPLNSLIGTLLQFQVLEVYFERIKDVFATKPEQLRDEVLPPPDLTGAISIEKVSFRYSDAGPKVLSNVSLNVAPGACIAIVGQSGCGKSTLARLLAGLYMPSEGVIAYDGQSISTLDRRALRHQIGVVTQDTQLFGGSIRRNIALADPDMELARVMKCAKLACIHGEIVEMPMGYETLLTDRGLSLSGGQRQRLAIARALANNPSLLILDEATSHLDAVTEGQVNATLASLECTRIIVAHRLSTIRNADAIVVLHNGAIVEYGKHEELVKLGGKYCELIAAQREYSDVSRF